MQFGGGMSIAQVGALWERDADWVEDAVRQALLKSIPVRDGGTKVSRAEARAERLEATTTVDAVQTALDFGRGSA